MNVRKTGKAIMVGTFCSLFVEILFLTAGSTGLSAWNWKHVMGGTAAYSLLAAVLGRKGIPEKEKKGWQEAGSEKNVWGKAVFIFEHAALVLPLFLLILWHFHGFLDLYRKLFAAVFLLIISPILKCARISRKGYARLSILAYGMLTCFIVNSLLWTWSRWTNTASQPIRALTRFLMGAGQTLGFLLMIAEAKKNFTRYTVVCIGLLLLWMSYRVTNFQLFLTYFFCVGLSDLLGEKETTAKLYLVLYTVYIIFMVIANLAGWTDVLYFERNGRMVPAYGMGHTNSIALLMMVMMLLAWYLWLYRRKAVTAALFALAAAAIWLITYCRTVVILLLAFAAAWLILSRLKGKARERLMFFQIFLPIPAAVGSYLLMQFQSPILRSLDRNFSLRFSFPAEALKKYPINWLGNRINYQKNIIDNVYLRALVGNGMIVAVILVLLFCWAGYRLYRNRQEKEALLLAFFVVYGLMEGIPVHIAFSFVPLLACAAGKRKEENGQQEIISASAVSG